MSAEVTATTGEAAAGSRVCHSRVGGGSFDVAWRAPQAALLLGRRSTMAFDRSPQVS